jgi:hypothetical protein
MSTPEEKLYEPKHKINLKNNPNAVGTQKPMQPQDEFTKQIQDNVDEFVSKRTSVSDDFAALAKEFVKLLDKKELVENKSLIDKEYEKRIFTGLVKAGLDLNILSLKSINENEIDAGTMPILTVICNCLLKQRDQINQLRYENYKTNNIVENLSKELTSFKERLGE